VAGVLWALKWGRSLHCRSLKKAAMRWMLRSIARASTTRAGVGMSCSFIRNPPLFFDPAANVLMQGDAGERFSVLSGDELVDVDADLFQFARLFVRMKHPKTVWDRQVSGIDVVADLR